MKDRLLFFSFVLVIVIAGSAAFVMRELHVPAPRIQPVTENVVHVTKNVQIKPPTATSSIPVDISYGLARVTEVSPDIFEYAHGTVMADGQIFIGMAARSGNLFPTNEVVIFPDPSDLRRSVIVSLPKQGDVETMVYDAINDKVYLDLSSNGSLDIYAIDPHTYAVSAIISTTTLDAGDKPAIVTDGAYIYGITNTDPSTVFKVRISDGTLATSSAGHIPNGHSAAIGIYASSTELYFGGGDSNGFEKVDAPTLMSIAMIDVSPCNISDDMPFVQTGIRGGYAYLGCEIEPYGERVDTENMTATKFALPGESLGLFIFGSDLYNTAQDGYLDDFPGFDIRNLVRYRVADSISVLDKHGQNTELNELFYSTTTDNMYFTAWWGIPGLYQVSTSTCETRNIACDE